MKSCEPRFRWSGGAVASTGRRSGSLMAPRSMALGESGSVMFASGLFSSSCLSSS